MRETTRRADWSGDVATMETAAAPKVWRVHLDRLCAVDSLFDPSLPEVARAR
jgi:hypothetical protein